MHNAGPTSYTGSEGHLHDQHKGQVAYGSAYGAPETGWDRVASLSMFDLIGQLWRQLPTMILVFVVIFAAAMFGVMNLKKEYTSQGRILVQFGEEYIYNPIIGTAGQGTAYSTDQMIQAEVGFFNAAILKQRVLSQIGLRKLFPTLAAKYEMDPSVRSQVMGQAIESITKNLGAYTAPNQPLISVSYRHKDPKIAAQVLSAIIDEYLEYRREVLVNSGNERFGRERQTTEEKLAAINTELALFLNKNGIGDFLAERTAAGVRFASLTDQLLAANARLREIDAGVLARENRMQSVPQEILQYTDDASSGELANLKIEREQLLSRYRPGSKPVLAIDVNIKRLERFIAEGRNKNLGVKRTGVNLVHQTLQSEKLSLESERQSIRERISVITAQINQVRRKQQKLQAIFPEYQRLSGKVEVLQAAVRQFSTREEEFKARRNLAEEASNNIRVIEQPTVPFDGKSMKRPATILAFLFAGFTSLMIGLAIVFSRLSKSSRYNQTPPPYHPPAPPAPPAHHNTYGGDSGSGYNPPSAPQSSGAAQTNAPATNAHPKQTAGFAQPSSPVRVVSPDPIAPARGNPLGTTSGGLPILANIERKTGPKV